MKNAVVNYKQFTCQYSWQEKARSSLRDAAILTLSLPRRIDRTSDWIRFPYYHHVFNDERKPFIRQIEYLRNFGDFISLDHAVSLLASGDPIDGRYFCITFDDGYRNCFTNALPILVEKQLPAAFFVPVRYIDSSTDKDNTLIQDFFARVGFPPVELLNWDECRQMVAAGMVVGSHTYSHPNLVELEYQEVAREMRESKEKIEQELGSPCLHFCCPIGVPEVNFIVDRDPVIAKNVGYLSFLTTRRGAMHRGGSPFLIQRDHTLAGWGNYQLRYFLSL